MYRLALFLCLFFSNSYAQGTIVGEVHDAGTGEVIPYISIGIIGERIGTVSNELGKFSLQLPEGMTKGEVRFSVYGYEPLELEISSLINQLKNNGNVIELNHIVFEQDEVKVIAPKKVKIKVLGKVSKSGTMSIGFPSNELGTELGLFLKIKKRSFLDEFNFYLLNNNYDSLKFRLNFYACDKQKKPTDSLLAEGVVFTVRNSFSGSMTIDLREYDLIVNQNVVLALEVIDGFGKTEEGKENHLAFAAVFGGNSFMRFTSQADWEDMPLAAPALNVTVRQEFP